MFNRNKQKARSPLEDTSTKKYRAHGNENDQSNQPPNSNNAQSNGGPNVDTSSHSNEDALRQAITNAINADSESRSIHDSMNAD